MDPLAWIPVVISVTTVVIGLITTIVKVTSELSIMKARMDILWALEGAKAVEALHHKTQPLMDSLLDGWKAGNLSTQSMQQLLTQLEIITNTPDAPPASIEAAKFLQVDVRMKLGLDLKNEVPPDAATQMAQMKEDAQMKVGIATEAIETADAQKVVDAQKVEVPTDVAKPEAEVVADIIPMTSEHPDVRRIAESIASVATSAIAAIVSVAAVPAQIETVPSDQTIAAENAKVTADLATAAADAAVQASETAQSVAEVAIQAAHESAKQAA